MRGQENDGQGVTSGPLIQDLFGAWFVVVRIATLLIMGTSVVGVAFISLLVGFPMFKGAMFGLTIGLITVFVIIIVPSVFRLITMGDSLFGTARRIVDAQAEYVETKVDQQRALLPPPQQAPDAIRLLPVGGAQGRLVAGEPQSALPAEIDSDVPKQIKLPNGESLWPEELAAMIIQALGFNDEPGVGIARNTWVPIRTTRQRYEGFMMVLVELGVVTGRKMGYPGDIVLTDALWVLNQLGLAQHLGIEYNEGPVVTSEPRVPRSRGPSAWDPPRHE